MGLFTFGRDRVEAAAMLDRVVDPDNWHRVYTVFKFNTDADKLRTRVGDDPCGGGPRGLARGAGPPR